jgi:Ni/Co efflux regulator RcnB
LVDPDLNKGSEEMSYPMKSTVVSLAIALTLTGAAALAEPPEHGQERGRMEEHRGEEHQGPRGYERLHEPQGWNQRPAQVDRNAYHHNFQASRGYHIGPYHRPPGWAEHRWVYGEILPRAYWAPEYVLADYWLFALEVPPAGFEWVRDGGDALLVNVGNGEILQVEYGVFM